MLYMIRVGRFFYDKSKRRVEPEYDNFTPILITYGSEYEDLAPWKLKDEKGRFIENIIQFSKVYNNIPATRQMYSPDNPDIIWEYGAEAHIENNEPNHNYHKWRTIGTNWKNAVSYPVGFSMRNKWQFSIIKYKDGSYSNHLGVIPSRKRLHIPLYCGTVVKTELFKILQKRHNIGENLLIIDSNGPHSESLSYYTRKYKVSENMIDNNTMLINERNTKIMMHDTKHSFGFGYCLAMALLGKDEEWNDDITYDDVLYPKRVRRMIEKNKVAPIIISDSINIDKAQVLDKMIKCTSQKAMTEDYLKKEKERIDTIIKNSKSLSSDKSSFKVIKKIIRIAIKKYF